MFSLPLVERELRVAARRPGTYWTRFWAALIFTAISLSIAMTGRMPSAQIARMISVVLGVLAFGYSLLAGLRYTSDCVSEERREGTLGFLFLTDLKGYDVVFGKLVVTSLDAFYGLLAVFPILALPVIFGGITGSEFWRLSLLLMNTMFFSLALGMLVSVLGREERHTMLGTLFALLTVTFLFPLIWRCATALVDSRWFDWIFLIPSPGYAFKIYASGTRDYWLSMLTVFGLGTAFMVTASYLLPRVFQESIRSNRTDRWAQHWHQWRFSRSGNVESHLNPFSWLVQRDRLPKLVAWFFVVAIIGLGIWSFPILTARRFNLVPVAIFTCFGLHLLLKFLIAAEACRRLSEEKRSGSLDLLLSTRLRMPEIAAAQTSALRTVFGPPIVCLMLLNLLWTTWIEGINDPVLRHTLFGGMAILPLDFVALSWVGMARALQGHRYHRAVLSTLGRVLLPPWVILFLFFLMSAGGGISSSDLNVFFIAWFIGAAIYDWQLMAWAKASITRDYPPPPPWFNAPQAYPSFEVRIPSKY